MSRGAGPRLGLVAVVLCAGIVSGCPPRDGFATPAGGSVSTPLPARTDGARQSGLASSVAPSSSVPAASSGSPSATSSSGSGVFTLPGDLLFTCGPPEDAFPLAALIGPDPVPPDAHPAGPALALHLGAPMADFLPKAGWRVLLARPGFVLFGAAGQPGAESDFFSVQAVSDGGPWEVQGWGGCRPFRVHESGAGPATWTLAGPQPDPATTEFVAEVTEVSCASGRPPDGRVVPPEILYSEAAVVVTFFVRHLPGIQECPGNPSIPYPVQLTEPLGERPLLDGGVYPPRLPDEPF